MEFSGGCLCGKTRYALKTEPFAVGDCHCIDCRRSTGAPCVTWGCLRREDVVVTEGQVSKAQFAGRFRCFAPCCGTLLFFEEANDSDTIDVTIGSLDDPARFPPKKAIWVEDKLPWVLLNESLPSFRQRSDAS
jgi:hypothetical protein